MEDRIFLTITGKMDMKAASRVSSGSHRRLHKLNALFTRKL